MNNKNNNDEKKTPWLTIAAIFIVPLIFAFGLYEVHQLYAPSSAMQKELAAVEKLQTTVGSTTPATAGATTQASMPAAQASAPAHSTGVAAAPARKVLASELDTILKNDPKSISVLEFVPGQNACAVEFTNGTKSLVTLPDGDAEELRGLALKANVPFGAMPKETTSTSDSSSGVFMVVSALIIGACLIIGQIVVSRRMASPLGKNKKKVGVEVTSLKQGKKLTWDDIGGCAEAVRHFKRLAGWAQNKEFYQKHNARMPSGVLLKGPPGTGKTLLLRILCNMLDGDGIIISGSDLVEMFVGVGAARVRGLFAPGREFVKRTGKPYIIGIDEIDAMGGHRAGPGANKHEEREQTLNALLVEIDGVLKEEGIIVIGMTNRPDMLDSALTRPGRLEYHVEVGLPDIAGREQILAVHMANKKVASDATPARIAKETYGMSGADLAMIANSAAMAAAERSMLAYQAAHPEVQKTAAELEKEEKEKQLKLKRQYSPFGDAPEPVEPERKAITDIEVSEINYADIDKAIEDLLLGEKLSSNQTTMRKSDKAQTVTHEIGHAVAQTVFPWYDPITLVSAQRRTKTLGVVVTMPDYDKVSLDKRGALSRIVMLMAGRCAQVVHLGTEDAGVAMDYQMATDLARSMVMQYGLGLTPLARVQARNEPIDSWIPKLSVGPRSNGSNVPVSGWLLEELDRAWLEIIRQCEECAMYIIKTEKERMTRGIEELSAKETIPGRDWRQLMENTASGVRWQDLPLFVEFNEHKEI
jgi:cell division protease FtsH